MKNNGWDKKVKGNKMCEGRKMTGTKKELNKEDKKRIIAEGNSNRGGDKNKKR